jgi:hypothetical protein
MILALLMAAQMSSATPDNFEALRAQLHSCEIPHDDVAVAWDEELQDVAVTIRTPDEKLSDAQLACLADLNFAMGATYVFTAPNALGRYYQALSRTPAMMAALATSKQETRRRLAAHGLLAAAQRIAAEAAPLHAKARQIEKLAGFSPGSMLKAEGSGIAIIAMPSGASRADMQRGAILMDILEVAIPDDEGSIRTTAATPP